jgi:hypothetical protein
VDNEEREEKPGDKTSARLNGQGAVPPTTRGSLCNPLMFSKGDHPVQKQIERTGKVEDIREDKITNNTGKERKKK